MQSEDHPYCCGGERRFRCYEVDTLSADRTQYIRGTGYCTRHAQLAKRFEACSGGLRFNDYREVPVAPTDELFVERGAGLERVLRKGLTAQSTIAVVGSSGNLVGRRLGAAIDAHSIIVRMNNAPTRGYEGDVGSRTDWRLSAECESMSRAWRDGNMQPDELLVFHKRGPWCWEAGAPPHVNVTLSTAFLRYGYSDVANAKGQNGASTGMLAVAMALSLAMSVGAPPISVYGFGACPRCSKYYDCRRISTGEALAVDNAGAHAFGEEALVRKSWGNMQGVLRLVEDACR